MVIFNSYVKLPEGIQYVSVFVIWNDEFGPLPSCGPLAAKHPCEKGEEDAISL